MASPVDPLAALPPPSRKVLYIMRGAPGSGKSHLAHRIIAARSEAAGASPETKGTVLQEGVVLSTDDYFIAPSGEYVFDRTLLGRAHEWNRQRCEEAMLIGLGTVVIDNTNSMRWEAKWV